MFSLEGVGRERVFCKISLPDLTLVCLLETD